MPLRERLKADLLQAMKARQSSTVTVLRTTLAAIDNAEAVEIDAATATALGQPTEVPRKLLTEADIQAILQREIATVRANIAVYEQLGNQAKVAQLQTELDVLVGY